MKEKALNFIRITTYYPRKALDNILFRIYFKNKNNWEILESFKNRPVLVVGNGPSLNETPLDKVESSFVSIGMNKINLIYEKTSWRPDIITCVNGLVLKQNKNFFNKTNTILVLPIKALYFGIKPRPNILFVNLLDQEKFEVNIEKKMSNGCTVTFLALQIAAYLSPKKVSLVGVDHNFTYNKGEDHEIKMFKGDDTNHFSKEYFKDQFWGVPNLNGSEQLYYLSKKYFDTQKICIKDYTVDGKLDVFEKADIEKML